MNDILFLVTEEVLDNVIWEVYMGVLVGGEEAGEYSH